MKPRAAFALIAALVLASRLCHSNVVWVEEGYPLAAALQMLDGRLPFRDFWFDKPPLFPAFYLLFAAHTGLPLRIAGAAFVLLCAWCAWRLGKRLWGEREGLIAAALVAFFLTFDFAPSVMALAPDLLMIAPHLAAISAAVSGQPLLAGLFCGVALLVNSKAVFVVAACLIWQWRTWRPLALGTLAAAAPLSLWLGAPYWQQVWEWGFLYSRHPLAPLSEGFLRAGSWALFHATLIAGAIAARREKKLLAWALISFASVWTGARYFPRYYFQLLPAMALLGARGLALMDGKWRAAALLLLAIPIARFGPRYPMMAAGRPWADLALHDDARQAARILEEHHARSLLVWGYRPEIFAWSRVPAATRFLDSQPLTGVLADRHLASSDVAAPAIAARNRAELVHTAPAYIVDGLGPLNPDLAITRYPDLSQWLGAYREVARTRWTIIYARQ